MKAKSPIVVCCLQNTNQIHKHFPWKRTYVNLTILDILEYQDYEEKMRIISDLTSELEEYARSLDCSVLYYEIPKYDKDGWNAAIFNGFKIVDEPKRVTSSQRTYLLSKPIALVRSNPDGCTLSRKQTKRTN